jgi:hypothetical protein
VNKAGVPVLNHISRTRAYMMCKLSTAVMCTAFLFACASGPVDRTPTVQVSGMVIENQTQMYVSAVRLLVPVTGGFVSCGNIPPGSMCSTTFPEAAYTGSPVEITWSQGGQIHSTGQFALQLPLDLDKDKPVAVRVVISGPGSAGAVIVQRPE